MFLRGVLFMNGFLPQCLKIVSLSFWAWFACLIGVLKEKDEQGWQTLQGGNFCVMWLSHLPAITLELPLWCETMKAWGKAQLDLLEWFDGELETAKDERDSPWPILMAKHRRLFCVCIKKAPRFGVLTRVQYCRHGSTKWVTWVSCWRSKDAYKLLVVSKNKLVTQWSLARTGSPYHCVCWNVVQCDVFFQWHKVKFYQVNPTNDFPLTRNRH